MAEISYPFDSGAGTAVLEADWGLMAKNWLQSSVIGGIRSSLETSLAVTLGSGLTFNIAAGEAFIRGFMYINNAPLAKSAPTNPNISTNPRIDRLVLRLDTSANTALMTIVEGTPGAVPTIPALTRAGAIWDMAIAHATCPGSGSPQNYNSLVLDCQWKSGLITQANSDASGIAHSPGDLWHQPDKNRLVFVHASGIRGVVPLHYHAAAGAGSNSGTPASLCNIVIPDPGFQYYILADGTAEVVSPGGSRGDVNCRLTSATGTVISIPGLGWDGGFNQPKSMRKPGAIYTGSQTVHLVLDRAYGGGTVTSSGANGGLTVQVAPVW